MVLTESDYRSVIGEMAYRSISQTDEEIVRKAEGEAQEEMCGYLRPAYDVKKIFEAQGTDRNPQIVMVLADIALYHLSAAMPQKMGTEVRKERYDRAIKWLEGVQAGKIVPDIPRTTLTDGSGNTELAGKLCYGSQKKLIHNW